MTDRNGIVERFIEKAEAVSALVTRVKDLPAAFEYSVETCQKKAPCRLLTPGADRSPETRIIAAPGLDTESFDRFSSLCRERNVKLIQGGLREYPEGVDIGFTLADYGIAETGTLVLDSSPEDVRLATMIGEIHLAVLPESRIRDSSDDLEEEIKGLMKRPPNFTAFITGASRTADIERILALGVHGPLELHILITGD